MVTGGVDIVRTLMEHDLADEYRLLVFPLVLATGERLFRPPQLHPADQPGADLITLGRYQNES